MLEVSVPFSISHPLRFHSFQLDSAISVFHESKNQKPVLDVWCAATMGYIKADKCEYKLATEMSDEIAAN